MAELAWQAELAWRCYRQAEAKCGAGFKFRGDGKWLASGKRRRDSRGSGVIIGRLIAGLFTTMIIDGRSLNALVTDSSAPANLDKIVKAALVPTQGRCGGRPRSSRIAGAGPKGGAF